MKHALTSRHRGICRFPPLEPETSSLFWLDTSVGIALTGQLYDKLIQPVYL